jgi:hypothetical protein
LSRFCSLIFICCTALRFKLFFITFPLPHWSKTHDGRNDIFYLHFSSLFNQYV